MDVLKRINKLRIERGWSVYRLSEEAGLPQSTVVNMFNRGTLPSLNTLESICSAYNISLSEFFTDDTRTDEIGCSKQEFEEAYSSLTPVNQELILKLMRSLAEK